jgi:hypothetical protein
VRRNEGQNVGEGRLREATGQVRGEPRSLVASVEGDGSPPA